MSIILQHQQQKLSDLKGQLGYVNEILEGKIDQLEPWEIKEYRALRDDYQQQINNLSLALNHNS